MSGVVNTAGMLSGRGGLARAASGLLGQGASAAGVLRSLFGRPETMQALRALFQGRNAAVPVGAARTPVPASAFAGLMGALAREAEAEALDWEAGESVPAYLVDPAGQLVVDPQDPDQRAARLLQMLAGEGGEMDEEEWESDEAEFEEYPDYDEAEDSYGLYDLIGG